jgi:hypothetical protein
MIISTIVFLVSSTPPSPEPQNDISATAPLTPPSGQNEECHGGRQRRANDITSDRRRHIVAGRPITFGIVRLPIGVVGGGGGGGGGGGRDDAVATGTAIPPLPSPPLLVLRPNFAGAMERIIAANVRIAPVRVIVFIVFVFALVAAVVVRRFGRYVTVDDPLVRQFKPVNVRGSVRRRDGRRGRIRRDRRASRTRRRLRRTSARRSLSLSSSLSSSSSSSSSRWCRCSRRPRRRSNCRSRFPIVPPPSLPISNIDSDLARSRCNCRRTCSSISECRNIHRRRGRGRPPPPPTSVPRPRPMGGGGRTVRSIMTLLGGRKRERWRRRR